MTIGVATPSLDFLAGSGETARLMRALDGATTPLGSPESWPQSLRSAVSILIPSKAEIILFWGPDFVTLYNDAYRPVLGGKHPWAIGRPGREVWSEIWDEILHALLAGVVSTGEAFWAKDRLFVIERHGYTEETYFDVSYDPVRDETGNVGGVFCIVSETTGRVLAERRQRTLRDLAARTQNARSVSEACVLAVSAMAESTYEIAFALLYLQENEGDVPALRASTPGAAAVAETATWPFAEVLETGETSVVPLAASGDVPLAAGERPPTRAAVLPIAAAGGSAHQGVLVVGLNPLRPLDDEYRGFLDLLASQVSAAIGSARAYETERRRAEALSELDRAKTTFFSNVSHEFRTPLTLLLGPLGEVLEHSPGLSEDGKRMLTLAQRNGQRLLKLVNTLLDFSRIEAGRTQASYVPTDLASLTADLASAFGEAVEKAGLRLVVDAEPLSEPVYVDHDMWEKIVLNLLSNALKFTFEGEIAVRVRRAGERAELVVEDTGTGIAQAEIPHLFERFWRSPSAKGRTHEGTGIGLALVQELVRLHGGMVGARSEPGEGSTFTVTIPFGKAHLPVERIDARATLSTTALGAKPFVTEALRWLPDAGTTDLERKQEPAGEETAASGKRVVWADDNADMREYVRRLLRPHYHVSAYPNGRAALDAVRENPPDLVLADVMMPELDGLELVRALRSEPKTSAIPVILLSARAGEDARIEGLAAGADEYLYKPFSARELLARIESRIELARLQARHEADRERALRDADRRKDEFLATLSHELRNPLAPLRNSLNLMTASGRAGAPTEPLREMMERQVNHLVRLVDDLLEMSRISRGALELRKEPTELSAIVRTAVETSQPLLDAARHELAVSLPVEPVWIDGDPVRLAQILSNLLNNAAKYTDAGGRISLEAVRREKSVDIDVRDNGVGITPEALPEVFEMFSRGERTTSRSQGGLGIGLALARRLVEMHGGTISAESAGPGQGSSFRVTLPITSEQPSMSATGSETRAETIPPKRVLVVDDNQDSAESMAALLGFLGADVRVAGGGREALEVFSSYDPTVVFLDIGMPEMDGYEVARRIRAGFPGRQPLLIALTGWGQSDDRRQAKDAGFDHHLVKPADLVALQALLALQDPSPLGASNLSGNV